MAFLMYEKMGRKIRIELNTPQIYQVKKTLHQRLPRNRVIGIDTETITRSELPVFKYLQLYSDTLEECYDIEELHINPLSKLFDTLLDEYGEKYDAECNVKQRAKIKDKETRKNKKNTRDGRRRTIKPIVLAFFNLDYDLGRLITDIPIMRRNLAYGSDSIMLNWEEYKIEIVYSCLGVACPSFQWYIYHPSTHRVIRIVGFDSTSYFKSSLKKVTKSLEKMGVTQKLDIESDIFTRDWDDKNEAPTEEEITSFLEYSITDAKCHRDIYHAIVELLTEIDTHIIDKIGCIPASAPSAAARIMMHLASKEEWESAPLWVQQMGLNAYKGAISFCSKPGYQDDVSVVDISSAYPHVMLMLPDFCTVEYKRVKPGKFSLKKYMGKWGVLVVSGESLDSVYPPLVTYQEGKQVGVYGHFQNFVATIPEIVMGVSQGVLRIDAIHDGFTMEGSNEESGLRKFIEYMYQLKSTSEKNGPMYLMAKLLMNSLYGKLIEKRHQFSTIPTIDENGNHLVVPNIEDIKVKNKIKELWLKEGFESVECFASDYCMENNVHPPEMALHEYLSYDTYQSGYYFNAPLAGQITGFTRAKLMTAARYLQAYSGDTDSIFCSGEKLGTKEDFTNFLSYLNTHGAITPSSGLGSFEIEKEHCEGLLVKKKVYVLIKEEKIVKLGHHGISGLPDDDAIMKVIKKYYKERRVKYTTKPRPIRIKDGLRRGKTLGQFVRKEITLTLEDNLYQYKDDQGVYHWKELPKTCVNE